MDSANGGLKLELSNAKLKTISDSQFMLWDEANKKVEYSYLSSKHKIDAVDPTVKLSALNNDKVGDCNIQFNTIRNIKHNIIRR